jgi:hypothetical protein
MITDTNNVLGFVSNSISSYLPGEGGLLFIGIIFFICVMVALMYGKVKASTSVMVGASMAVMLSFVVTGFGFIFWIAILASLFVLINAIRKRITGQ